MLGDLGERFADFLGVDLEIFSVPGRYGMREYPHMGVVDLFSDELAPDRVLLEGSLLGESDLLGDSEIIGDVGRRRTVGRNVPYPAIVVFRYDERMSGRQGVYVEKGEEMIVFVYDMRRYLFFYDFAENAF